MIEMAVGDQDLLDGHAMLRCGSLQLRQVTTGIAEGAEHSFGAPNEGAILLERRDGNNGGAKGWVGHI